MIHHIKVLVDDNVRHFLKKVPRDEWSRTISLALHEWAHKRLDAAAEMDRLRNDSAAQPVTTAEIVRWIREDRDGGH